MTKAKIGEPYSNIQWFEHLFGFKESVDDVYKNIEIIEQEDRVILKSKANNKEYNAGLFLERSVDEFPKFEPRNGGKLSVLDGETFRNSNLNLADVLTCQSCLEFNGATYQAASNFNCLEFVSSHQSAADGITYYVYDQTQGPFAALAAGPAILYRNYFLKRPDGSVGQIDNEVKLLERTPITVENGYAIIKKGDLEALKTFDWTNYNNFKVGIHRNCQVTTARATRRDFADVQENLIVHHVYAAALNFMGCCTKNEFTLEISTQMLTAEYRATILSAWENSLLYPDLPGAKKCFLTLLGGGVFDNPIRIIATAIMNNADLIKASGLEVIVVFFNDEYLDDALKVFKPVIDETGGRIITNETNFAI